MDLKDKQTGSLSNYGGEETRERNLSSLVQSVKSKQDLTEIGFGA